MNDFLLLTHQTAPLLPALLNRLTHLTGKAPLRSWGLGYFQGKGCQVFVDRQPLACSRLATCLRLAGLQGQVALTTYGEQPTSDLADLGPFCRELRGDNWLGIYLGEESPPPIPAGSYRPIGKHRAEHWLCASLNRLAEDAVMPMASDYHAALHGTLERWLRQCTPAGTLLLMNHTRLFVWTGRTVFACHDEQGFWLSSAPLAIHGHHLLPQRLHQFTLADADTTETDVPPSSPCRESIAG